MKHALVVGGSGMLAKTSLWLAETGYNVSVIGRNMNKLGVLAGMNKNINPISVDYNNEGLFRTVLNDSIHSNGPYDLVVAWIHSDDKSIIQMINSENNKHSHKRWSLVHVLGSRANLEEITREIDFIENCDYYQVQLGFINENNQSRWLTHDEISNGVINCIKSKTKQYLVGTLTPWSKRPS